MSLTNMLDGRLTQALQGALGFGKSWSSFTTKDSLLAFSLSLFFSAARLEVAATVRGRLFLKFTKTLTYKKKIANFEMQMYLSHFKNTGGNLGSSLL